MDLNSTELVLPLGYDRGSIGGTGNAIENTAFYIRSLIHSGHLSAGERLPSEADLCEFIGVSRVTLRAALQLLQTLGFVVIKRGRNGGSWVADLATLRVRRAEWATANTRRIEEMLVFMGIVESEIAALAARNRTAEDLEALEASCQRCDEDSLVVQKWHMNFHSVLARAAHNEFLERAMVTVRGEMFAAVLPEGEQPESSVLAATHCAVFAAVRDRDEASARTIMKEHHQFLNKFFQIMTAG